VWAAQPLFMSEDQNIKAPMWNQALATFLEDYMPASDLKESTHQFSTTEIKQMLASHTGEYIDITELCEALELLQFRFIRTGDLQLEWLLKKV
jgi:hypothetical protein